MEHKRAYLQGNQSTYKQALPSVSAPVDDSAKAGNGPEASTVRWRSNPDGTLGGPEVGEKEHKTARGEEGLAVLGKSS